MLYMKWKYYFLYSQLKNHLQMKFLKNIFHSFCIWISDLIWSLIASTIQFFSVTIVNVRWNESSKLQSWKKKVVHTLKSLVKFKGMVLARVHQGQLRRVWKIPNDFGINFHDYSSSKSQNFFERVYLILCCALSSKTYKISEIL